MGVLKTALRVWLGVILALVVTPVLILSLIFLGVLWTLAIVLFVVGFCGIVAGLVVIARDWSRQ